MNINKLRCYLPLGQYPCSGNDDDDGDNDIHNKSSK